MIEMQTSDTPGRRGATRAAYDANNPLLLVKKIWDEHPTADLAEIKQRVHKSLARRPQEMLDAFIDYAVANCVARIVASESVHDVKVHRRLFDAPVTPTLIDRHASQIELAKVAATMRANQKNAWLLEMPAPNGKALGDCTGTELSQFTGFYKTLAAGIGASDRLRDVKTGDDVAAARTWAVT